MKKLLKKLLSIALSVFLFGGLMFAAWTRMSPSEPVMKSLLVTQNGLSTGSKYFEISGWLNKSYVALVDVNGTPYITGESLWLAQSGNYVQISQTGNWNTSYAWIQTNSGNALKWSTVSGDYYTSGQVDLKIASFAWGMTYVGAWSMLTWAFPTTCKTGDTYRIQTAGTGGWVKFNTGDMMIANRATGSCNSGTYRDRYANLVVPESDPYYFSNPNGYITATGQYWIKTGTVIYYTGGNVWVWMNNPNDALDVSGTFETTDVTSLGTAGKDVYIGGSSSSVINMVRNGFNYIFSSVAGSTLSLWTSWTLNRLVINGTGNVGIGTTTPAYPLDVSWVVNVLTDSSYRVWGAPAIGASSTEVKIGSTAVAKNIGFYIWAANTAMYISTGWFVGIGTGTPTSNIHIYASNPVIRMQNSNTSGNNTFLQEVYDATLGNYFRFYNSGYSVGIFDNFGMVVGNDYATSYKPPVNGMFIEWNVGIGTTSTTIAALEVWTRVASTTSKQIVVWTTYSGASGRPQYIGNWYPSGFWGIGTNWISISDPTVRIGRTLGSSTDWYTGELNLSIWGNIWVWQTGASSTYRIEATSPAATLARYTSTLTGTAWGSAIVWISDWWVATSTWWRLGLQLFGGAYDTAHSLSNAIGWSAYATELWTASKQGSLLNLEGTPTGSTTRSVWATFKDGNMSIATQTGLGRLDVSDGSIGLVVGADAATTTRTDATVKTSRIAMPHYTNAQVPFGFFLWQSTSSSSILGIGWGSSLMNAATQLSFYAATNTTTTSWPEKMRLVNAWLSIWWSFNATQALDVSGSIQTNWAYMLTGGNRPIRITASGDNLLFQVYSWATRTTFNTMWTY